MFSSCNLDSMMLLLKHPFYLPAAVRAIAFHFNVIALTTRGMQLEQLEQCTVLTPFRRSAGCCCAAAS